MKTDLDMQWASACTCCFEVDTINESGPSTTWLSPQYASLHYISLPLHYDIIFGFIRVRLASKLAYHTRWRAQPCACQENIECWPETCVAYRVLGDTEYSDLMLPGCDAMLWEFERSSMETVACQNWVCDRSWWMSRAITMSIHNVMTAASEHIDICYSYAQECGVKIKYISLACLRCAITLGPLIPAHYTRLIIPKSMITAPVTHTHVSQVYAITAVYSCIWLWLAFASTSVYIRSVLKKLAPECQHYSRVSHATDEVDSFGILLTCPTPPQHETLMQRCLEQPLSCIATPTATRCQQISKSPNIGTVASS